MTPYRDAPPPAHVCPRCGGGLRPRRVADAHLEDCPSCEGVFVAAELMPRVTDGLDLGAAVIESFPARTPEPGGEPRYLRCPHCNEVMNRKLFAPGSGVIVDVCTVHGVWFDDAELRAVAVFAAGGGLERAAARERAYKPRELGTSRGPEIVEDSITSRASLLELVLDLLFRR